MIEKNRETISHIINKFKHIPFWIILIILVTLLTRITLYASVPSTMFFYDSYIYFSQASLLLEKGIMPSVDLSYSLSLAGWLFAFDWIYQKLVIARFFNICLACLAGCLSFELSKKFSNEFAFTATLLLLVEPIFLSLSITTHNDVFALVSGLVALYSSFSKRKILYLLVGPLAFLVTVLSKSFLYVVLGIPLLFVYSFRILGAQSSKRLRITLIVVLLTCYFVVPFSPIAQSYYYAQTRFDPLTKALLFLKPDILNLVISKTFLFTSVAFLNMISIVFFIIGSFMAIYSTILTFKNRKPLPRTNAVDQLPLIMLTMVVLSIFALSVFTIQYQITNGALIPILTLNMRYLIWPRLGILWLDVFALWQITRFIINRWH
jgi:hypothetical protein